MLLMEEVVSHSDKAETGRMQEKRGYSVFGKEYEQMLRHDLHAENSIDHQLLRRMVLLEEDTAARLYSQKGSLPAGIQRHPLYDFAGHFAGSHQAQSIDHLLRLTKRMAENFAVPFEQMRFGGTEREILLRSTDWCSDMARLGAVLLMCLGISARILILVNRQKAYHGHVVTEAFYEDRWGVVDFLYGCRFYQGHPLSGWELKRCPQLVGQRFAPEQAEDMTGLYDGMAVNEYDPMDLQNDYTISGPNEYYLRLMGQPHDGWFMGEDGNR